MIKECSFRLIRIEILCWYQEYFNIGKIGDSNLQSYWYEIMYRRGLQNGFQTNTGYESCHVAVPTNNRAFLDCCELAQLRFNYFEVRLFDFI